jgi:hypothetical protein
MAHLLHLLHLLQVLMVNGMAKILARRRDGALLLLRQDRLNQALRRDGPVLLQNLVVPLRDDYPTLEDVHRDELDDLVADDLPAVEESRRQQAIQKDCSRHEVA